MSTLHDTQDPFDLAAELSNSFFVPYSAAAELLATGWIEMDDEGYPCLAANAIIVLQGLTTNALVTADLNELMSEVELDLQ